MKRERKRKDPFSKPILKHEFFLPFVKERDGMGFLIESDLKPPLKKHHRSLSQSMKQLKSQQPKTKVDLNVKIQVPEADRSIAAVSFEKSKIFPNDNSG
jgi:hypothetical protein